MTPDALVAQVEAAPKPDRTELVLGPDALAFAASLSELDRMRLKQRLKAAGGVVVSDWWRALEAIVRAKRVRGNSEEGGWQDELVRGEQGHPLATARNLGLILRNWERTQNLRLNELTLEAELDGVALTEGWYYRLRETIEGEFKLVASSELTIDAVAAVAEERVYHPIREYLDGLRWDGQVRLHLVPTKILRAPEAPLFARMVTAWFVSAVARIYQPGCQVDTCLTLYSEKGGLGKSTFFDVVTGQDRAWATRGNVDPADKDSLLRAHRVWVQVLDEIDEFTSRHEWPAQKRWMTERLDIFRAPYMRRPAAHPRRFVFGATTNKTEYIPADSAAARRLMTIPVGDVDLDLLAQRADQLWAEAKEQFLSATAQGTKRPGRDSYLWWLRPDEAEAALELASDHQPAPIHREAIEAWLAKRFLPDPPRTEEILSDALNLKRTDYGKFQHAVGDAMRSLGYVSKNCSFENGPRGKGWVKA